MYTTAKLDVPCVGAVLTTLTSTGPCSFKSNGCTGRSTPSRRRGQLEAAYPYCKPKIREPRFVTLLHQTIAHLSGEEAHWFKLAWRMIVVYDPPPTVCPGNSLTRLILGRVIRYVAGLGPSDEADIPLGLPIRLHRNR